MIWLEYIIVHAFLSNLVAVHSAAGVAVQSAPTAFLGGPVGFHCRRS